MGDILTNVALVLLFVLIGGFFAAAEMALVSLREGQVRALAERGRRGTRVARLVRDPNRFLSAVQIGVTLAGFFSAAFGAATLAEHLTPALARLGMPLGLAKLVSLIGITVLISYVSLVLGELAPKRLALQRAEGISLLVAPFLDRLAWLSRPVIWLLSRSTNLVVRLLGGDPRARRETMTEEELRDLVARHQALTPDERMLIEDVFAARDRPIREVLVPRTEVEFIEAATPLFRAAKIVAHSPYSRFPVYRHSYDDVVGFVHVRDLLDPDHSARPDPVTEVLRPVKFLPASKHLLAALSEMRREGSHLAIVVDEYGGTAGIVTLEDLLEEVIGDIRDEYDVEGAHARRLRGGAMEVDGRLNLDDFAEETGITLPEGPYETVAGFVLALLGHLATVGESVEAQGYRLTVTELDGRRIARLRVAPLPPPALAPRREAFPKASPAERSGPAAVTGDRDGEGAEL